MPIEVPLFETVTVAGAVDIRRVAEWAGASVQDIQDLNPELRRWTTPIRATEYELKVPMGAAEAINTRLTEQGGDDLAPLSHYTVKKNETLPSIAKKLGVSRSDLAEANYLSAKSKLETGQQLVIPRAPTLLATRTETGGQAPDAVPATATRQVETDDPPARTTTTHRVAQGETLSLIAKLYGTTVAQIKELNNLRNNVIHVGQRLLVERLSTLATN